MSFWFMASKVFFKHEPYSWTLWYLTGVKSSRMSRAEKQDVQSSVFALRCYVMYFSYLLFFLSLLPQTLALKLLYCNWNAKLLWADNNNKN